MIKIDLMGKAGDGEKVLWITHDKNRYEFTVDPNGEKGMVSVLTPTYAMTKTPMTKEEMILFRALWQTKYPEDV